MKLSKRATYDEPDTARVRIRATVDEMTTLLGDPYRNGEPDYPDDDYKTDVCWCVENESGQLLTVWNFKNGPAYLGDSVAIDDIGMFSARSNIPGIQAWVESELAALRKK